MLIELFCNLPWLFITYFSFIYFSRLAIHVVVFPSSYDLYVVECNFLAFFASAGFGLRVFSTLCSGFLFVFLISFTSFSFFAIVSFSVLRDWISVWHNWNMVH